MLYSHCMQDACMLHAVQYLSLKENTSSASFFQGGHPSCCLTLTTTFDLRSGYHHMELSPEARAKSAFVTPLDKFEFTRCPFGLSQGPAYFQRLINKVIKGLPFAFGYLDDVLIHNPDIETHL